MDIVTTEYGYAPLQVNLCGCWDKNESELTADQRTLVQKAFHFGAWGRATADERRARAALFDYHYDPEVPKLAHAEQLRSLKAVAKQIALAHEKGEQQAVAALTVTQKQLSGSAFRLGQGLRASAQFFTDARGEPLHTAAEVAPKTLNCLLAVVEALCHGNGLDIKRHAQTARRICDLASEIGLNIGETTIEEYLRRIPDATAARKR